MKMMWPIFLAEWPASTAKIAIIPLQDILGLDTIVRYE
jgi:hypothetical protein